MLSGQHSRTGNRRKTLIRSTEIELLCVVSIMLLGYALLYATITVVTLLRSETSSTTSTTTSTSTTYTCHYHISFDTICGQESPHSNYCGTWPCPAHLEAPGRPLILLVARPSLELAGHGQWVCLSHFSTL